MMGRHSPSTSRRYVLATVGLLVALFLVAALLTGATIVATAANNSTINETAPYYDNQTSNASAVGWVPPNATLDSIVGLAVRMPDYLIGTGEIDESGTGFEGVLLTGLFMLGASTAAVLGVGIGAVGGTIVALSMGFMLTSIGLAPAFVRPIMLFGIGIAAATALRRVLGER
jgi:hypothetical protein